MVFIGPRTKVHRIDEGYAWVPRTRVLAEDLRKEIQEIKVGGFRRLPTHSSTLEEIRDSSYYGFSLHIFADFWVKMVERAKGRFGEKNAQNPTFFT